MIADVESKKSKLFQVQKKILPPSVDVESAIANALTDKVSDDDTDEDTHKHTWEMQKMQRVHCVIKEMPISAATVALLAAETVVLCLDLVQHILLFLSVI